MNWLSLFKSRIFNNLKIKQKTFILISLTALVSICMVFFSTYIIYRESAKTKVQHYNSSIIEQIVKNIDSYFLSMQNIAYSLAYNPDFHYYISLNNKTAYEMKQQEKFIRNALRFYYHSHSNMQICIFIEDNMDYVYTIHSYLNHYYTAREDKWYKAITQSDDHSVIILNNPQKYYEASNRKTVHSIVFKIESRYSNRVIGYIIIDIEKNQLENFFQTEYVNVEKTIILDIEGQTVYNYPEDLEIEIKNNIAESLPDTLWGHYDMNINDELYMVIFGTSEYSGWRIVNIVSYKEFLRDLSLTKYLYLFIIFIVIIIAFSTSYGFSSLITNPILILNKAMNRVKTGDLHFTVEPTSSDELGELFDNFNSMTNKIDFLIKENESAELLKRDASLKALQQQINPHFLFNTLEMVMGASSEGENDHVISICKSLGRMLRYNLDFNKFELLEKEVDQIKDYIYIMEQRFEGRFTTEYDIDLEALSYKTVKFTLQPFVENSIIHGFDQIINDGIIRISIKKIKNAINIQIEDNGSGFTREKLDAINKKIYIPTKDPLKSVSSSNNLGIMNVHLRLRLFFGEQYRININSIPNYKTIVSIEIPAV